MRTWSWSMGSRTMKTSKVGPHTLLRLVPTQHCILIEADGLEEEDFPPQLSQRDWTLDDPEGLPYLDYDLVSQPFGTEYTPNPIAKRQRAESSPLSGFASKVGSRMPSFSRKWRSRKASPIDSIPPLSREASLSRANSTRAPSFASANMDTSRSHLNQVPPTPAASTNNDSFEHPHTTFADATQDEDVDDDDFRYQAKPTTPLLPPVMTDLKSSHDVTYQSPLDSPSVAEPGASSVFNSPQPTPQIGGLPSPPLSTRPSVASFHHRQFGVPIIPSSEIPPMLISGPPPDKWSDALGHANFTIQPEPYTPDQVDLETCKALRANWDLARHNYTKHLMRVGDNSGPTSKIYQLTQDKWAEIDSTWKKNVEACVAQLTKQDPDVSTSPILGADAGRELAKTPPLVKIPSLNGPKSEGKFPKVGDEGIVGPMEVVPARIEVVEQQEREQMQAQAAKRKRKFGGFIKDWLIGVGMFPGSKGAQEA